MSFEKLTQRLKIDPKEFLFQFQSDPNYPTALALSLAISCVLFLVTGDSFINI